MSNLLKVSLITLILIFHIINTCYSGSGLESNLSDWQEDQNNYNEIIKSYADKYGILPFPLKVIIGQENRGFKPGLPQGWKSVESPGKGPGRGLGQIEVGTTEGGEKVRTYESILLNYGNLKYLSGFQTDKDWQKLASAYQKVLPKYNWNYDLAAKSSEGQKLLNYGKSKYPLISKQEYINKIASGGFNNSELEQMASVEVELLGAYYRYLLASGGASIMDPCEEAAITAAAGYKEGPGTLKLLMNEIVDPDGDGKNLDWSKWATIKWGDELSKAFAKHGIPKSYYDNIKKWLNALMMSNGITAEILSVTPQSPVKPGEIKVKVKTSIGLKDAPTVVYKSKSGNYFQGALSKRISNTTFEYTAPVTECNDGEATIEISNPVCDNPINITSSLKSFCIDTKKPEVIGDPTPKPGSIYYVDSLPANIPINVMLKDPEKNDYASGIDPKSIKLTTPKVYTSQSPKLKINPPAAGLYADVSLTETYDSYGWKDCSIYCHDKANPKPGNEMNYSWRFEIQGPPQGLT